MSREQQILSLFEERGLISRSQEEDLRAEATNNGKSLMQAMVDFGIVTEPQYYQTIAEAVGADYMELGEYEVPPEVQRLIPGGMARLHGALPISEEDGRVTLALIDPLDQQALDDLRFALDRELYLVVVPSWQVEDRIRRYYGADTASLDEVLKQLGQSGEVSFGADAAASAEAEANSAPIIRFVDLILFQAIQDRASDIHFEPFENEFKIRYRVDGALYEIAPPPRHLAPAVTSRVKVMSNLNIAERRLPQDGRIQRKIGDRQVDLRVSTLPTQFGESVVLRVLDRSVVNLDLETLGMPDYVYQYILDTIEKPNGIFIVTGPTGSGKTTTLYSCLRKINTIDTKLLTAEDPVEYDLEGIVQVPINDTIGLTFGRVLRAFLRQDPDRIMIGETRDIETAQIAIQASLTGHLVFTTLHTNDSAGAVTRLIDMGVEPFLISATLEGVLAQRLIRRICPGCRVEYKPGETVLRSIGLTTEQIGDKRFYYGKGCEACNQTGYRGRKGIYELLQLSDPLRELINERAPSVVLKQKAVELGMQTLREDGLRSIYEGETTIEEVLKYT
ncbi:MAG: type II/IV secretion system protein [Verrucomicrobia bacterium]|nr:type II/IV secretion system protein [Verrucomicrobiota bacterium]